jgi:hypothetical protein
MKKRVIAGIVFWFVCTAKGILCPEEFVPQNSATPCSIDELRTKADEVLSRADISVRGEVDIVFELIDRLLEENQSEVAESYLIKGLTHYPWNLKYQMIYAELLMAKGNQQAAVEKARLILEYAENADLIDRAMKMLGQPSPPATPDMSTLPETGACIVLVPIQGCAEWLLARVQKELSEILALPVYIQKVDIHCPEPSRDRRGVMLNLARRNLLERISDPEIKTAMIYLNITKDDLDAEEPLLRLLNHLLHKSKPDAVAQLHSALADGVGKDPQWDVDELHVAFSNAIKPFYRENIAYLGITPVDIYAGRYNFLFAKGRVISYHRFTAEFNGETPNQRRLIQRVLIQCLASAADSYDIPRCATPTCAHAYPNSLAEHDAKTASLCSACRDGFSNVKKSPLGNSTRAQP